MQNVRTVKVWDIAVRIFHWSLVVFFTIAYLTGEDESDWHIYAGYAVLALICFRVVWGLMGSPYARFSQFVYAPATVVAYAKSLLARNPRHYLGHNPLGGYMVIALLLTLFAVTLSGLKLYAVEENAGPFALVSQSAPHSDAIVAHEDEAREADEEFWEQIHETTVDLMLALVALHILGVIISSRLHKESLVKAMITGNKSEQ